MKTKLVIFDFDGTLCDTHRCIVTTMQQTQKACRLPVASEDVCASTIGLPLKNCFMHIYPDLSDAEATKCADTYRVIFEA
ncbi:MAG: HAD family hydrolase, partial [Bacteroidaceae bacterium]|nr:HAD family hydrolase [Bacteroidaceae bacterium]